MENSKIVKTFTDSHITGDWETYNSLCTEDFSLIGPGPEPLDKGAFLTWLKSVYNGNTDIDNNVEVIESSGDSVKCSVQMEGKHSNDWDLSFIGVGVIPATNKSWKNPKEEMIVTTREGKVTKIEVSVPKDGGIPGILSQLGVKMPE
ncbi:MAG: nuclear transport factor 2 family protein [Ignavibacterium sp.]|nr:MAG: nuclear transport factor 2 family protein [Ignavibacterium sp.]